MDTFVILDEKETNNISGGLLGGALAGAILGGTVGLIGATGYGVVTGQLSGSALYKSYVTGALCGAAIGTVTPV